MYLRGTTMVDESQDMSSMAAPQTEIEMTKKLKARISRELEAFWPGRIKRLSSRAANDDVRLGVNERVRKAEDRRRLTNQARGCCTL